MTTSPRLGIPYIASQQATPEVTHNEALLLLQVMLTGVLDRAVNVPAVGPADGDSYILGAAPTGAWAGRANCIAVYVVNQWRFLPGDDDAGTPIAMGAAQEGMNVWVCDENIRYTWTGAAWTSAPGITAADVAFTPVGTIAATNVQAAIAEAASEAVQVAGHSANSVYGRASNSSGAGADILAGTNDRLFAQTSNALSFVQLTNGMVPTNTVGLDKLANAGAQYDVVGRKTSSSGAWEDCTRTQLLLAGTDLANNFTAAQTINSNGAAFPSFVAATTLLGLMAPDATGARIELFTFGSGGSIVQTNAPGTAASPTASVNGNVLAIMGGRGRGTTGFINGSQCQIRAAVDGATWTDTSAPAKFEIRVCRAAAVTNSLSMTWWADGGISTASMLSQGLETLNLGGALYVNNRIMADVNGLLRATVFTVATLPTAVHGARAHVSDALAPAFGVAVAAGGAVSTPVYGNAAPAWIVG